MLHSLTLICIQTIYILYKQDDLLAFQYKMDVVILVFFKILNFSNFSELDVEWLILVSSWGRNLMQKRLPSMTCPSWTNPAGINHGDSSPKHPDSPAKTRLFCVFLNQWYYLILWTTGLPNIFSFRVMVFGSENIAEILHFYVLYWGFIYNIFPSCIFWMSLFQNYVVFSCNIEYITLKILFSLLFSYVYKKERQLPKLFNHDDLRCSLPVYFNLNRAFI